MGDAIQLILPKVICVSEQAHTEVSNMHVADAKHQWRTGLVLGSMLSPRVYFPLDKGNLCVPVQPYRDL